MNRSVAAGWRAAQRLQETSDVFLDHFTRRGFRPLVPEPIIPRYDSSIRFTNSAVVPFKPLIRESGQILVPGHHLVQPCIRAHNLGKTDTDEFFAEFLLAFSMLGVISPAARRDDLAEAAAGFLSAVGLRSGLYRVLAEDSDLYAVGQRTPGFEVETNTRKGSYYRWSFGEPEMTGRGSTFATPHAAAGLRDLGNLIAFEWQRRTVAYGFGVGLESVQSCIDGVDSVVRLTPAGATLAPVTVPEVKLADLIGLLVRLIRAQIRPSARGQGHVARQAVLKAVMLSETMRRSVGDVAADIAASADAEHMPLVSAQIEDYLHRYGALTATQDAVRRIAHLSFLLPAGVEPQDVLRAIDFSSDATVRDASIAVIDVYTGAALPAGRTSVTVSVDLAIAPGTPMNDVLRAALPGVEALGGQLRGDLD